MDRKQLDSFKQAFRDVIVPKPKPVADTPPEQKPVDPPKNKKHTK